MRFVFSCIGIFGVIVAFADSNIEKQITIKSRIWELAPEGKALAAPSVTFLLGREAMIHVEEPKYSGSGLKEGFRLKVKALESRNGLLVSGYVLTGLYDPNEAELEAKVLGLFNEESAGENEVVQSEWAKELEVIFDDDHELDLSPLDDLVVTEHDLAKVGAT